MEELPTKKFNYRICTLSLNCEAYCDGDCDNCGLFQNYRNWADELKRNRKGRKEKDKNEKLV